MSGGVAIRGSQNDSYRSAFQSTGEAVATGRSADSLVQRVQKNWQSARKDGELQGKHCGNCGFQSPRYGSCPAADNECQKCGRKGHFARRCSSPAKDANEISAASVINMARKELWFFEDLSIRRRQGIFTVCD